MKQSFLKVLITGICFSILASISAFASHQQLSPTYSLMNTDDTITTRCTTKPSVCSKKHKVTVTLKYADQFLPDSTKTYSVKHGQRFEEGFKVADGYELTKSSLKEQPTFDVDMDTKKVSLDKVEGDYGIELTFSKTKSSNTHNVTVITKYLDNALPEDTKHYQVPHGSAFSEHFYVLDGYELSMTNLKQQPVFDADMDTKIVSLDIVETDYTITLVFEKQEYSVKLTTTYLDNYLPDSTKSDWIKYNDPFHETYEIADGYKITNLDQLPAGVVVDQNQKTVKINKVTQNYDISLEFEKVEWNVTVTVIYEDGAYSDKVDHYRVADGDAFETDFYVEEGYTIKKVNFDSVGVTVDKGEKEIIIDKVTSNVNITIRLR